jgi:hypothetical protein
MPASNRTAPNKQTNSDRGPSSIRLTYTVPLLLVGFILTSVGSSPSPFAGVLFVSGILLWIIGVLGTVYCVMRRLAGPTAAKLVVGLLILTLLSQVIFGRAEKDDEE